MGEPGSGNGVGFLFRRLTMDDWNEPSTLALVALLIGIALGTLSGYTLALDLHPYQVDNDTRTAPIHP